MIALGEITKTWENRGMTFTEEARAELARIAGRTYQSTPWGRDAWLAVADKVLEWQASREVTDAESNDFEAQLRLVTVSDEEREDIRRAAIWLAQAGCSSSDVEPAMRHYHRGRFMAALKGTCDVTEAEEIAAAEALVIARYQQQHGVSIEAARRDGRMFRADVEYLRPQARAALEAAREVRS